MANVSIDQLVDQLKSGQISRRGFVRRATALGISASAAGILARGVAAQEASPAAGGTGVVALTSPTRDEVNAQIEEAFPLEEVGNTGGDIIIVDTTDIQTLNPTLADDVYSSWITGLLFDAIIGGNPVDGTDSPGLADYWTIDEDSVTYTFYLNQNAKWHDGTPVTTADIEFTFQSVLAEDSLSVRRGTVASTLKELRVIDDHTFQLIAIEPSATFVVDTAGQFGILPKHIWESVPFSEFGADGGSTGSDPSRVVGSGAFKFVEWVSNDHVTVERNPDYYDTPANIDRFIYQVMADGNTALQTVVTGGADVLIGVPYAQVETTRAANPELTVSDYDTTLFNFYHCNQNPEKEDLFVDVAVRQAMLYALDRELVAETAYMGFAEAASGTQPVLSVAYAPDRMNTTYSYDPDMARSLLEQAGWVDSDGDGIVEKDGQKFSFECIYSEGVPTYEQQVPYMQQAWREVGIEMIPSQVPFPTLSDSVESGNYAMCIQGFQWSVDGAQIIMFGCDYTPPAGFNRMHYCNPAYDELENAARIEVDPDARVELLIEASNIVNDEVAVGVIVFRKEVAAIAPRVHNFFPNGYSTLWSVTRAWVDA